MRSKGGVMKPTTAKERETLDKATRHYGRTYPTPKSREHGKAWAAYKDAADAYGDARELKGHVAACGKYQLIDGYAVGPPCGDKWYCEDAPIKERS